MTGAGPTWSCEVMISHVYLTRPQIQVSTCSSYLNMHNARWTIIKASQDHPCSVCPCEVVVVYDADRGSSTNRILSKIQAVDPVSGCKCATTIPDHRPILSKPGGQASSPTSGVRYFFGAGFEGRLFPWMTCRKPILTLRSLEVLSWAGALWPGASTVLCQAEEG